MNECLHFHHKTAIFPISSIAIIHDEISTVPPRRKVCRKDFLDFKGPAQAMKTGIKQKSTSRRIPEISRAPTKSEGQAQATSSGGTRVRASGFNLFLSDSIESCFIRSLKKSTQPMLTPKKEVIIAKRQKTWIVAASWEPADVASNATMSLTDANEAPGGSDAKMSASQVRYITRGISVPRKTADLTAFAEPKYLKREGIMLWKVNATTTSGSV